MITSFTILSKWFLENQRDFPWRMNRTFYRVWVSEIMLQQTRAEVVIPYFQKWMDTFPDIESLALAPLSIVIKCWEGLGYYSRARNLHEGAKQILAIYGKEFPKTYEQLNKIKGIGPYTIGAILSFAYKEKAIAIDGNVLRVLSRFFLIEDPIDKVTTKNKIATLLERYLPDDKSWIFSEALIELGALVCKKNPDCGICPMQDQCLAKKEGKAFLLPIKEKKLSYIKENRIVFLLGHKDHIALLKNDQKIMKDLYEFPYCAMKDKVWEIERMEEWIFSTFQVKANYVRAEPKVSHTYTKYRIKLFPFLFSIEERKEIKPYTWIHKKDLHRIPFSSGHKKIKESIV